jgi:hypothetical protein
LENLPAVQGEGGAVVKSFESRTCPRCGGSGEYSHCEQYGTRCFKCQGRKQVLTARGVAAAEFFRASLCKPASEFKAGDRVYIDGLFVAGWRVITEIKPEPNFALVLAHAPRTLQGGGSYTEPGIQEYGCSAGTMLRAAFTAEEKAPKMAAALAYQETLTKKGTVSKRKAVRS